MALGTAAVERGAWDEAVLRFEQAVRLRRSDSTSRFWKGMAFAGQGLKTEAAAEFESAIRSAPRDWPLLAEAERRLEEARR